MPEYLFAYGTLLPGAAPAEIAGVAARLKAVGEGSVRGRLYDLGHFPGAVLEAGEGCEAEHFIHGTVFELPGDGEVLRALDAYEEFDPENAADSQFLRRRCVVRLASGLASGPAPGTEMDCWIYVYNRGVEHIPVLEGGRWNGGAISV